MKHLDSSLILRVYCVKVDKVILGENDFSTEMSNFSYFLFYCFL